jgi:hypothetical protein
VLGQVDHRHAASSERPHDPVAGELAARLQVDAAGLHARPRSLSAPSPAGTSSGPRIRNSMATQPYAEFRTKGRHDCRRGPSHLLCGEEVIANGYLRLEREGWIRAVEKGRARLGPYSWIRPRAKRVNDPLMLPLAVVVAFLVGFTIGYRHGFSRRQTFANVVTSRRSHRRL